MEEGLGDHILLLRLWEAWRAAAFHRDFCRDHGLDLRGMNFAKDIRKQLEGGCLGRPLQAGRQRACRQAGSLPSGPRGPQCQCPSAGVHVRRIFTGPRMVSLRRVECVWGVWLSAKVGSCIVSLCRMEVLAIWGCG